MAADFQVAPSISLCSLAQGQRIIPGVRSLGLIIFEHIGMQRANTRGIKEPSLLYTVAFLHGLHWRQFS